MVDMLDSSEPRTDSTLVIRSLSKQFFSKLLNILPMILVAVRSVATRAKTWLRAGH